MTLNESATKNESVEDKFHFAIFTRRAFGEQHRFVNQLCEKVDVNTSAFLLLQSGCRWLGMTLDSVGAFAVLASIVASLAAAPGNGDAPSASVGLAMNYILLVPTYLAWVVKFLADIEVSPLVPAWRSIIHADFKLPSPSQIRIT